MILCGWVGGCESQLPESCSTLMVFSNVTNCRRESASSWPPAIIGVLVAAFLEASASYDRLGRALIRVRPANCLAAPGDQ